MASPAPFLWIALAAFLIAVPGCMLLFGRADATGPAWHPRRLRPTRRLVGLLLVLLALTAAALSLTLYRYVQLFHDRPVAILELRQEAPQRFHVRFSLVDQPGQVREYLLLGDAWQVDARVLRWEMPAVMAGVPALYRLDRISGRYDNIDQERTAPRSAHALDDWNLPDLWTLKQQYARWLPFVDARYGSATWMPMANGARYLVLFNDRGGLLARPADPQTERMMEDAGW